ncbi:hypothetical protein F385_4095 [Pantoea agglomerans 299R]|nr:hypothetical protein F385_4095 [Pantoea agglomerans 299R]
MYRSIALYNAGIMAQTIKLKAFNLVITQPLRIGHPVTVSLFAP